MKKNIFKITGCLALGLILVLPNTWADSKASSSEIAIVKQEHQNTKAKTTEITKTNINTANVETLEKIKGFSKRKAVKVIEYREQHGNFKTLEELLNVQCRGIHQEWLNKVEKFLTI
jgi:DNA uptake protein and related DNA-binding proteins